MNPNPDIDFAAIIGVDWADKKHDICLFVSADEALEYSVLPHTPEAIDAWVSELRQRFAGWPVALCLEQKKGALIYALMKYASIHLAPINPQTLARYRRAFKSSHAKDDPTDAELLLDLYRKHHERLPAWAPDSPQLRALQQLVEMRRTLIGDQVRLSNRIIAALKNYYPQPLNWFKDKNTTVFCDFLLRWPSLRGLHRVRDNTLKAFFYQYNVRYASVIQRRIKAIRAATPLTEDPGITEPSILQVSTLARQLKTVLESLKQFEIEIESRFQAHQDAALFSSLPGAGRHLAPRLLVAFGEDRSRYQNASQMQQYTGIAPVTERSGQKRWVHWRYACPKFLRQTFVEWAGESITFSYWAKQFYLQQRDKGKTHRVAVRALAFKRIRILYRCWQENTPCDEARYLMILKEKGSPLLN